MAVTNGYLSVDEFRDIVRDQLTAYDAEYERAIGAASRQIDDYCGRHFWTETKAKVFRPTQGDLVWTGDIASATGVIVETDDDADGVFESTWSTTDWQLEPFDRPNGAPYERVAAVSGRQFPTWRPGYYGRPDYYSTAPWQQTQTAGMRRPRVRVTATWGWPEVPQQVVAACVILAVDTFKAKDLMHVSATYGNEVRVARDMSPGFFGRRVKFSRLRAPMLNPEAEALISSLRITTVA